MAKYDFSKLPKGVIQIKNRTDIIDHVIMPNIAEILKSEQQNMELIIDYLDLILDVIEEHERGKDEFFSLVGLLNSIDKNAADIYLQLFEDIVIRKEQKENG